MFESQKTKELREKLSKEVYTDLEKLIEAAALRHTILNLGQNWPEIRYMNQLAEDDETYRLVQKEYKSWLKDARKEAKMVVKAKLPLTLESMELAFSKKGPFAPKGA